MAKVLAVVLGVGAALHAVLLIVNGQHQGVAHEGWVPAAVAGLWLAAYAAAAALVVREAVSLWRTGDVAALRNGALLVKGVAVAFFALNFFGLATVLLTAPAGSSGGRMLGAMVLITYLVMLPTSAYGLALLAVLQRGGAAGAPYYVLNVAAHLLFVLDVASTAVVAIRATQVLRGTFLDARRLAAAVAANPPYGRRKPSVIAWVHGGLLLLAGAVPALVGQLLTSGDDSGGYLAILVVVLACGLGVLVVVAVLVDAVVLSGRRELTALAYAGLIVKLGGLPIVGAGYLLLLTLVFGVMILSSMTAVGAVIALAGVTVAPLAALAVSVVMLPTSVYGIACLILMRRDGVISVPYFAVLLVMHLVCLLDLVGMIFTLRHARSVVAASRAVHQPPMPLREQP